MSSAVHANGTGNGMPKPQINGKSSGGHLNGANGFKLGDFSIDEGRPLRVVVIGAGISGILAGIRIPQRIPTADLVIYDKNAGIGGTWYSNTYPGIACDAPSHCYQFSFEDNPKWSKFFSNGSEILEYLNGIVHKYKVMRHVKLHHEILHARYDEGEGKWHLKIRRPASAGTTEEFEEFEDTADVVISAAGALSRWVWPDIDGIHTFKGKIMHSAAWDMNGEKTWQESVKDWKDKKVGLIGTGSSAIQILPELQPRVRKLELYARGQTWLAPPFAGKSLAALTGSETDSDNYEFTDNDWKKFEDPEVYKKFRHNLEQDMNSIHAVTTRGSDMQKEFIQSFRESMLKKLAKRPYIAEHIIPDFPIACRRITPGPGYLDALCQDNVTFIPTLIKCITETGVELVDGTHRELDAIVCATGFDTSFQFPFSVVGRNGYTLQERFDPHPETYLSVCTDGFPNFFMALGPNSIFGTGTLIICMERQIDFIVNAVKKMQRERLKSMEATREAVKDFDEYIEHYFPKTVFGEKCASWYKRGKSDGRVVGLWPGSCLHSMRALENPRWEDFKYEFFDGAKNRFYWLGDGSTYNEAHMTGDRAWYLNEDQIDYPPIPE
ncbi:FAD/NAD-binding domain-containing protein [Schizopora paradoxa]|uniref:FAD/NAD-binding domain-containing protein n=1 Tax=Schizopora paradoxa TaxID=27342 RepID=A0A0H2R5P0_9AGAM|nr:FAD/NAD-binding domain-containing protein [Schizopora paradoxa]